MGDSCTHCGGGRSAGSSPPSCCRPTAAKPCSFISTKSKRSLKLNSPGGYLGSLVELSPGIAAAGGISRSARMRLFVALP